MALDDSTGFARALQRLFIDSAIVTAIVSVCLAALVVTVPRAVRQQPSATRVAEFLGLTVLLFFLLYLVVLRGVALLP
jgi:hypothetical protein